LCTNCVFGTEVETEEQKNRRRKEQKEKRTKGEKNGRTEGRKEKRTKEQKNRRVEKGGVSGKRVFGERKDSG
jgi:hypothetical protein